MIEFRLKELAQQRGITTAYQLQVAMGVDPGTAARLWKKSGAETEGITFGMIERLCRVCDCEPGDLLVLTEGKRKSKAKAER
jgi:DNA-binding Xre family transcriptional regulator